MRRVWRAIAARDRDLVVLGGFLLVVALVWLFFAVAGAVTEGETSRFDVAIVTAFRQPGHPERIVGPPFTLEMARDVTALGGITVMALVNAGVAGFLLLARKLRELAVIALAVGGGAAMSVVLKGVFGRPRPTVVPQLDVALSSSFPSGHSILSAVVYLTLAVMIARFLHRRALRIYVVGLAVVVAVLVGVSRVALGVHWPTDVVAGWSLGAAWAVVCGVGFRVSHRRAARRRLERAAHAPHALPSA